jgi:hypothetical protein
MMRAALRLCRRVLLLAATAIRLQVLVVLRSAYRHSSKAHESLPRDIN